MEEPVQPEINVPLTPEFVTPEPMKKKGLSGWVIALIVIVVLCCCVVVVVGLVIGLGGTMLSDLGTDFKFNMDDFQYLTPLGAFLS